MAKEAHSSLQATSSPWFRWAIVKTLAGALLGLVTAALLVLIIHGFFSEVADFDYDFGLRMQKYSVERFNLGPSEAKQHERNPDAYLLLDVDPQPLPSSSPSDSANNPSPELSACAALSEQMPDRYTLVPDTTAQCPDGQCSNTTRSLNCNSARPLNRYLLTELVKEVRRRGARLIVLDILLATESGVVPAEENAALREALWSPKEGAAPVIFVRPARFAGQSEKTGAINVIIEPTHSFDPPSSSTDGLPNGSTTRPVAVAAVAFPAPGQPLRRYPKCYQSDVYGEDRIPSLPYLASALLMHPQATISTLCTAPEVSHGRPNENAIRAQRIHYTLPSLRADMDNSPEDRDTQTRLTYREVYDRCLASNFWTQRSLCSAPQTYKDKIVVIGATNPRRQDRHYTPFGDMAGAEVVINTIRSFMMDSVSHEESLTQIVLSESVTVLRCMIAWFVFYCLLGFINRSPRKSRPLGKRIALGAVVFVGFAITLIVVLGITVRATYASFSVLVGVLSIGIEQYVEVMKTWILHPFERLLERLLRLPTDTSEH